MELSANSNILQRLSRAGAGFLAQLEEVSSPLRWADVLVFALILGFGLFQFFCADRARDFLADDVLYSDAGRSLIEHGFYGFNGQARTIQPPGLPAILGLLCVAGGDSHAVFLRTMAVFATLGFMASYELLRRQAPRVLAASICLLLISSPFTFRIATQWVCSAPPYFFATISALLVARKLEEATHSTSRIGWGVLLTALIAVSLMLASAAIAFLGGMVATICVGLVWDRRLAFASLRSYLAVLLVGITVQGLWMHQKTPAAEWPLPSHQDSYLAQLKMKSGNQPELGFATPRDVAVRILENASAYSGLLSSMLLRRSTAAAWMSIFVVGPLLLIILGWCSSIRKTGDGLQEWYFAGYGFMYLLWPWFQEPRFFLPVAPLACLYIWHGGKALVLLARNKPRMLGSVLLPVATVLAASTWLRMHGWLSGHLPDAGLRNDPSLLVWLLSAILAAWMVMEGTNWQSHAAALLRWVSGPVGGLRLGPTRTSQVLVILVVASLVVIGFAMQVKVGQANLDPNSDTNRLPPDVEAARWIQSNTDASAVVMARLVPTVNHYSKRKVIWFYPTTNPQLLMEGIMKHKVAFIIVASRESNYYLPPDDQCFDPLLAAHTNSFRLVCEASKFKIFQVRGDEPLRLRCRS